MNPKLKNWVKIGVLRDFRRVFVSHGRQYMPIKPKCGKKTYTNLNVDRKITHLDCAVTFSGHGKFLCVFPLRSHFTRYNFQLQRGKFARPDDLRP